ncbi:radical SAM family heme chaperone HemW [Mariprofundus ferrooxydans]|uniref:radical SAM family heme chaperone HemW n=1 Tax=Mariprofundus ferrooxydans TaxID=314344 RepID=UPI0014309B34|nr:radical SAM family heme chaperone HemW [Mariprofundus ferrooxydans]
MTVASPLRLYVHIPFCAHKCHYCDFNSHVRDEPPWQAYQQALLAELTHWSEHAPFAGRTLASIFFGGGTPSLAPPALIAAVISAAEELFGLTSTCEITLEANPGSAEADRFLAYRQAGINRLSIGVQSLDAAKLRWLERIHGPEEATAAFHMARRAGFDNINLDLMFGLPEQDLDHWLATLRRVVELAPEHLSCYQLTVEAHTALAVRHAQAPYPLPDDELALAMLFATREHLAHAGYQAYEVSNFSRPDLKCRHNDGYWQYDDYIGIGAGAAGKWDEPDLGVTRYSNTRAPERYIETATANGCAINSRESLDHLQAAGEACWLALRRTQGIDRAAFKQRFGTDAFDLFAANLQPWLDREMLKVTEQSIFLTPAGLPLADTIAASVL